MSAAASAAAGVAAATRSTRWQADPVLFGSLGDLLGPAMVAIRRAEHEHLEPWAPTPRAAPTCDIF